MNAQEILNDCEISEQERADINISKCMKELKGIERGNK